jgi:hypothetical protein
VDHSAEIAAAKGKLDSVRTRVTASLSGSPSYQSAKTDADAADAELKLAHQQYAPGSQELISASQSAMLAHKKLADLVSGAMARDPAAQQAEKDLQSAQSLGK